jgi:asparaginyl-tRNA synthetase
VDVQIRDLRQHTGHEVTIGGWLHNRRDHKKVSFLMLRDGTGLLQAVAYRPDVGEENWERVASLTQESSLRVTGVVREIGEGHHAPGGVEMSIREIEVLQVPAEEYPITPKEHGPDFLMRHRHLWLRSQRQWHIQRIRNEVIYGLRTFFYDRNFLLFDSPILTGAIGESAGELFEIEYFDLGKAYLSQTGQLYQEAAIMAHRNTYCFGPTFRAEKSKTRKHLTEFWMLEAEMAYCGHEESLQLQEDMVVSVLRRVLERCPDDLREIERPLEPLERAAEGGFVRLPYRDAVELLRGKGSSIEFGMDLGAPDETIIGDEFDRPTFVTCYPRECKAFYMKRNPDDPTTVLCADLIATEDHGEVIGGSAREDDLDLLLERIRALKLPEEPYEWYLDLRRYGTVPHAGFGLGLERLVKYICGLRHIREACCFPRMMEKLYP